MSEVSPSDCSSVSLIPLNSSNETPPQVLPREDYSIDIAVVLASMTDSGSPCPASVLFLYGSAAAVASAFVPAACTSFWITSQPGLVEKARTAMGSHMSRGLGSKEATYDKSIASPPCSTHSVTFFCACCWTK